MPNRRRIRGRNPWATHPLLGKGGVHEPSRSGQRSQTRQSVLDEADDYMQSRMDDDADTGTADASSANKKREPSAPFSFYL